ncbi:ATP-binding protein [Massilia sp. 9096]|uniref:sensor histidine kinase n=1 Tax=Massilia sp. 9096 TaxID=1500894 RepID=UPI0005674046|nr:ATP-binding protein [Massilia sp. 9096]
MAETPNNDDEAHRLQVLLNLNILDTPAEERFDRITRLASRLFNVPIALVSLVDANRQWFKSRQGLAVAQTDRSMSFCSHAIKQEQVMVVEDALQDPRFVANPLVSGDPNIRFYAGSPLVAPDGSRVGTLCLIDRAPRAFSAEQAATLRDLAAIVANELAAVELNRAIQVQRESEAGMHALIEYMPEGVLLLDAAGNILFVNPAAERIFQRTTGDLVGRSALGLLAEPDVRAWAAPGSLPNLQAVETVGRRADGSQFPLEFTINRMLLAGERRITAIVRDISIRRQVDDSNRATDERRRKYFATATHELRTPMASVLGFSELLLKRDFDPATGRELIEIIHRQASRLVALINQLLDLARIEAGGKESLDIRALAAPELIEQTLAGLVGLGDTARIQVTLEDSLPPLLGDADKLQQALTNIVSNSVKYSAPGSPILLDAAPALLEATPAVAIRVRDQGIGMTPEQVAQVFDAFYRADNASGATGSGLGMTIFKEIIDLHGGTVELTSTPGSGTSITMVLPAGVPT